MKLRALALDFDGTIAVNDTVDANVAAAIQEARRAGLLTVLVTGRTLRGLKICPYGAPPFDAIVAENGAVLKLPDLTSPITLSQEPDLRFLTEMRRRGIRHQAGQCLVEAAAAAAPQVVDIIRELGLPLGIAFNLGRLMVLPHGVSKASGLQEALWRLRASVHNTIAVGNAENDHQLLEACEIGAAVAWGSDALRRSADEVVPGDGPSAVARYIREALSLPRIPPGRMGRRRVRLGTVGAGEPLDLAIRGRNLLIGGDPEVRQVVGGWASLRATDSPTLLALHPGPGGRLHVPGGAAWCDRAAAERPRDLVRGAATGADAPRPEPRDRHVGRFRVAPRLTAHVRHRQRYAEVPVCHEQAFVFTRAGRPTGRPARTVQDLLSALAALPGEVVHGHLARGDFHRWVEDIFGDRELGGAIRRLEHGNVSNARDALRRAIAERYGGAAA